MVPSAHAHSRNMLQPLLDRCSLTAVIHILASTPRLDYFCTLYVAPSLKTISATRLLTWSVRSYLAVASCSFLSAVQTDFNLQLHKNFSHLHLSDHFLPQEPTCLLRLAPEVLLYISLPLCRLA